MRHGEIILIVLSLALASHGQADQNDTTIAGPDPVSCKHNVIENEYYTCSGDITVTIVDIENKALIDCNGGVLDCSKLQQFPYRGSKILQRLLIRNCLVNSLECVLASLNATGVSTLFFQGVSTPVTEDTVRGLDMLKAFFVYDGLQNTVPVEVLKRFPNLTMHRLHNDKITALDPNTFNQTGVPDLTFLEISCNNITTLPADPFNGLRKLETLNLFKNNFQEFDVNSFRGLDSLTDLYLDDNSFSVLPSGLFLNAPLLTNLSLLRNIKDLRVQAGAISGLDHLVKLELSSYGELKLDPASLSNLRSLRTLKLDSSGITGLPADLLFNTTSLESLNLRNNILRFLPESLFSGLGELQMLDLSNNKLERVTEAHFTSLVKLKEIYLDRNLIATLPERLFFSGALRTVSISHNLLYEVHKNTFLGAERSITRLDLSHNRLEFNCFYPEMVLEDEDIHYIQIRLHSPLSILNIIEELNLSHNNISSLCGDWIELMTQLRVLDLSNNALNKITSADLNFVSHELKVDFRNNNITAIEVPTYTNSKPNLLLGQNPFYCDCNLYQFLKELKNLPYDMEGAKCHLPQSLNGVALSSVANEVLSSSVSLSNLTCPLPDTPSNCSCVVRPAKYRTECACRDMRNVTLPPPTYNGLNITEMMLSLQAVDHVDLIPSFVTKLNLSNLGLRTLPDIPATVTYLDLRHNNLSSVPLKFLRRNITLELGKNPLECDCWRTEDVKILQAHRSNIRDYDSLVCTDGADVGQVNAERLCDVLRATVIGTMLAVIGLIVAITGTLIYKYMLEIRVCLYNWGWTWLVEDEALDESKIYDVFISYYNADAKFVNKILFPELEKDYKVCIHSRDFPIGGVIPESICFSVAQSKRTVIVLSKAFLADPNSWVYYEFQAVVTQTNIDRRQRAVLVVLDDVNFDNAPDIIKDFVKMNTYIKWGDKWFWENLRYALPKKKLKAKDVKLQRSKEQAVKSLGNGGLNAVINADGKLENLPELKGAPV